MSRVTYRDADISLPWLFTFWTQDWSASYTWHVKLTSRFWAFHMFPFLGQGQAWNGQHIPVDRTQWLS